MMAKNTGGSREIDKIKGQAKIVGIDAEKLVSEIADEAADKVADKVVDRVMKLLPPLNKEELFQEFQARIGAQLSELLAMVKQLQESGAGRPADEKAIIKGVVDTLQPIVVEEIKKMSVASAEEVQKQREPLLVKSFLSELDARQKEKDAAAATGNQPSGDENSNNGSGTLRMGNISLIGLLDHAFDLYVKYKTLVQPSPFSPESLHLFGVILRMSNIINGFSTGKASIDDTIKTLESVSQK